MLASALPDGAELWSYDLHVALRADMSGPQLDAELRTALDRYGLVGPRPPRRRRLAHRRAAAAPVRARLRRRRPHLRGRARRLRALERARRARRAPALPRRRRRRRLREPLSRDRAARRRDRARRRGARAAAGRRLDRALHAPRLMQLVAVVLSWNGREDTLAALESLRGIETVCVDNGSADGSADAVAERFPEVELDPRPASTSASPAATTSGSGGRSTAARTGCCSLNNDALVEPGLVGGARARRPRRGPTPACSPARCSSPTPTGSGTPAPASTRSSAAAGTRASASRTRRGELARHAPRDRRGDGGLARRDRARRPARRGALPLRRGSRVVPAHPRGGLRGRLRARARGCATASPPPPAAPARRRRATTRRATCSRSSSATGRCRAG